MYHVKSKSKRSETDLITSLSSLPLLYILKFEEDAVWKEIILAWL